MNDEQEREEGINIEGWKVGFNECLLVSVKLINELSLTAFSSDEADGGVAVAVALKNLAKQLPISVNNYRDDTLSAYEKAHSDKTKVVPADDEKQLHDNSPLLEIID